MPENLPDPQLLGNTIPAISGHHQYYLELHAAGEGIINDSIAHDTERLIAKSHSFISDLEIWLEVLAGRPELPVLQAAVREYQFSILALLQGQYRYSFMALRLFFELSLASIRFSAHEIEYWLWERGQQDIKWATLVERDISIANTNGNHKNAKAVIEADSEKITGNAVLSLDFVRAFSNQAFAEAAPSYRTIASKVYRECSEFVHGNSQTHSQIPGALGFSQQVLTDWLDRADSIKLVVLFALCGRHLKFLDASALAKVEPIIRESLGHVDAVRNYLDSCTSELNKDN